MADKLSLHQVISVVMGKKTFAEKILTDAHQKWSDKSVSGIARTYVPLNDDGDKFPPENNPVQTRVEPVMLDVLAEYSEYLDAVATQETGNTEAKADILIDSRPILQNVPVGVLLFMEKRLEDLFTFVNNLPVLPADRTWTWNAERNCYVTEPVQTVKTQKTKKALIRYEATKEHPAQTEVYDQDVVVGHWTTVQMSGAIPAEKKSQWAKRIRQLQEGVRLARDMANNLELERETISRDILRFVFGDLLTAK